MSKLGKRLIASAKEALEIVQEDNLAIPDFLKRASSKVPAKKEVTMSEQVATETAPKKPKKAKAAKPAKEKPVKAKAAASVDAYSYRTGSLKSQAAAMYALKAGATLKEVKDKLGSTQLNLLKDLEGRGFKVKRVKEAGDGKRKVTRYFLSK